MTRARANLIHSPCNVAAPSALGSLRDLGGEPRISLRTLLCSERAAQGAPAPVPAPVLTPAADPAPAPVSYTHLTLPTICSV
eukprot:7313989-Alexandrium_andersonii.AAC.1